MPKTWSSLVEGGEGSYLPNHQTTAYHLGRYEPSAHILKLNSSSWRCNLKIWMHLDHMLKFLFLDATWSFKIKMITFARLYKPLLEDDSSSFTLVQSWNFDPARSRLNFFTQARKFYYLVIKIWSCLAVMSTKDFYYFCSIDINFILLQKLEHLFEMIHHLKWGIILSWI